MRLRLLTERQYYRRTLQRRLENLRYWRIVRKGEINAVGLRMLDNCIEATKRELEDA